MKKIFLLVLLSSCIFSSTSAQKKNTYLYLEVNKNLPVQVTLNNKALRNDNKGYIIIPKLPQGQNTLGFKFSNPNYKPHQFKIEAGAKSLGLKLARIANDKFVLQDVVNNRMIRDVSSVNRVVDHAVNANQNIMTTSVKKEKKKGQAKVNKEKKRMAKRATSQIENAKTKTKAIKQTSSANQPKRTYAMYQNRTLNSAETTAKRYKNYRKVKRDRKRQARLNKVIEPKTARAKVIKPKTIKAKSETVTRKSLDREKLQQIKRQKRIEQERVEYLALEKKRTERRAARALRKQERNQEAKNSEQADIIETKKIDLRKRKKAYDKENLKISEKIINAEPIGSPSDQKGANKSNENIAELNRCLVSVRAEKVADWTTRLHKKYDDEARTNYIKRKLGSKCISNNNLGVLLTNYETQIGRFKLIRSLYSQLENPNDMIAFQRYFQSKSYITKLKELRAAN